MGLVDGDGYISIIKTTRGYIAINLVVSLDSGDLKLLKYIQCELGIGRIEGPYLKKTTGHTGKETVRLVFNATELQYILFPLILHHGLFFLTYTRKAQFDKALHIISKDILKYEDLGTSFSHPFLETTQLPSTSVKYTQLPFFTP